MDKDFKKGFISSVPIILGYFFVSIAVGVYASQNGFTPLQATIMSLTNMTSAGELAAIRIFEHSGGYIELLLCQVVINARYALMGLSLTQRSQINCLDFKTKLISSFAITDEIFAVLINKKSKVNAKFLLPLMLFPLLAWSLGTFIGSYCGKILQENITSSLSILVYTMLISIVAPEAKEKKPILLCVLCAILLSIIFYYLAPNISSGYSIIITSVIAASISSLIFPIDIPTNDEKDQGKI